RADPLSEKRIAAIDKGVLEMCDSTPMCFRWRKLTAEPPVISAFPKNARPRRALIDLLANPARRACTSQFDCANPRRYFRRALRNHRDTTRRKQLSRGGDRR